MMKLIDDVAKDIALLINRVTVGWVFFNSGLIKLNSWSSTQYLFQYEYRVPFLPWEWAAVFGTASELLLGLLLIVGLLARPTALALLAVNFVAYISYAHVLGERAIGALDHELWAVMLCLAAALGAGRLSLEGLYTHWRQSRLETSASTVPS